jgi:uncharacterized protein YggU (UPF0235/DUF167 family)
MQIPHNQTLASYFEKIRVKAVPDAKKEKLEVVSPGNFRVFVREPAERNQANRRITQIIAEYFRIPSGKLHMISGHRSLSKIFQIRT